MRVTIDTLDELTSYNPRGLSNAFNVDKRQRTSLFIKTWLIIGHEQVRDLYINAAL